ncbi:SurA N-terminal domain-containing protein [Candidatus Omnitrophota bacterium]
MKGKFYSILIFCFIFSFFIGCSSASDEGDTRIVAEVNRYEMMVKDLEYELKNVPFDEVEFLKTEDGRKAYIDRLLEKEILLQEAQRQGLDREKDFMKSIENYWEQALLKILVQKKSKEISSSTHVYSNEIEKYYKNSGEKLPLSKVTSDIRRRVRQEKEREAMEKWVKDLRERSHIKINEGLIEEIFSRD